MTGRLPFAPAFDHLVYVRVFEGCNLHCQHCFIPSNPKKMTEENLAAIPETVAAFAQPGSTILLQWHGGEPTIFGADWLRRAIEAVEETSAKGGYGFNWLHGIQTNLMTYGPDWVPVYQQYFGGQVGVSWDPVIRLTNRNDAGSNAAYEAAFWPKFDRLLGDGLNPYLVVTFTRTLVEQFRNPLRLFDFLASKGVRQMHLERVTRTGYARDNWDRVGLDNAEYSHHMGRFLRAYAAYLANNPMDAMRVSPFDGLLSSVADLRAGQAGGYGCWSGHCDTTFHTIDANGYKRGCTALTSELDNSRAAEFLMFPDLTEARAERRWDCKTCDYRKICSSGCLASMMDDGSGECAGGSGLFRTADGLLAGHAHLTKEGSKGKAREAEAAPHEAVMAEA